MLRENQEGDSEDINEAMPEFARTGGNILEYYIKTWRSDWMNFTRKKQH